MNGQGQPCFQIHDPLLCSVLILCALCGHPSPFPLGLHPLAVEILLASSEWGSGICKV